MQNLAQDVGGLKRALTNVKTRGVLGEAQLGALLEQYLSPGQYEANVKPRPRSNEIVEYAVKLPGVEEGSTVWLPIDAKFPIEDYQRLMDAYEAADKDGVEVAGRGVDQQQQVAGLAEDDDAPGPFRAGNRQQVEIRAGIVTAAPGPGVMPMAAITATHQGIMKAVTA